MSDARDASSAADSPNLSVTTLPLDLPQTPSRTEDSLSPLTQSPGSDSDDDSAQHELPTIDRNENDVAQSPPLTLADSQRLLSQTQTGSTPISKIIRNGRTQGGNDFERKAMEFELGFYEGKDVKIVSMESAKALFAGITTGARIDAYLRRSKLYVGRCWSEMPREDLMEDDLMEDDLYDPHVAIATEILDDFEPNASERNGATRQIIDSHKINVWHENGKNYTSPDISIKASGSSFGNPVKHSGQHKLGYANIAAVFDAKVEKRKGSAKEQARQLGVYIMQLLIQQPNRRYVRVLIVTERTARLFHFDRSGVYATPYIDIHDKSDPDKEGGVYLFVRWVLALSSYSEEELGFDTSVKWTIDADGKKSSGTITVNEYDEETKQTTAVVYDLNMEEPPFVRPSLTGRGTTIWHARHPVTGEQVSIKDSWRLETRLPESDFMKKISEYNIPGVAEMLGFEDYCSQTKDFRPDDFDFDGFLNRVKLRIVMKKYGLSIWYFRSRLQFLEAILAAIIAHSELFRNKILHRDISMQNLVLGCPTSESAGYLIDLDMALDISIIRDATGLSKDKRTGFIFYQSYFTLISESLTKLKPPRLPPPHDYLDDVECFFYVTCHGAYSFEAPGKWKKELPFALQTWAQSDSHEAAARAKRAFCEDLESRGAELPEYWGEHCETLIEEFGAVVFEIQGQKKKIFEKKGLTAEERWTAQINLANDTARHFDKVKKAFEKAIAALKQEGLSQEELVIYKLSPDAATKCLHFPLSNIPTTLPFEYRLPLTLRTAVKRAIEVNEDDDLPSKRNRQGSPSEGAALDTSEETAVEGDSEGFDGEGSDGEDV